MREKERELCYLDFCGQIEGQVDYYDYYVYGFYFLGVEGCGFVFCYFGYRIVIILVLSGRGV